MTGTAPSAGTETITRYELAKTLADYLIPGEASGGQFKIHDPAALARDIFAEAARRREPEYEPGTVCQDAAGQVWLRCAGMMWQAFGPAYSDSYPTRPLRKLVPEPALTGKALHSAILEELDDQMGLSRSYCVDLAWSICKMIGVERP